jgi:hypothetical protein
LKLHFDDQPDSSCSANGCATNEIPSPAALA